LPESEVLETEIVLQEVQKKKKEKNKEKKKDLRPQSHDIAPRVFKLFEYAVPLSLIFFVVVAKKDLGKVKPGTGNHSGVEQFQKALAGEGKTDIADAVSEHDNLGCKRIPYKILHSDKIMHRRV
jgi:hypothetical protein